MTNLENNITIKNYLPLVKKQVIISTIVESAKTEEGKIDFSSIDFLVEISLLSNYTNMELPNENLVDFYDEIKENGILSATIEQIDDAEINFIKNNVDKEIQQYLDNERSLGIQLKKAIDKLIEKIPSEDSMKQLLSDENIKKLGKLTKDLNKTFSVVK